VRGARASQLESPTDQLMDLVSSATTAMKHATAALLSADHFVADHIGAAYDALSTLHRQVENHAGVLLATRARSTKVDLPAMIAAAHINAEAESMGRLAQEVAEIARTRRSWASIPAPLLGMLGELSEVCLDVATKAAEVVESSGTVSVVELDERADEVDRLQQVLYQQLLSPPGIVDVDAAIDLTMAARCYQRYADLAVTIASYGPLLAIGMPRH
jgi:phosphate transport system protein